MIYRRRYSTALRRRIFYNLIGFTYFHNFLIGTDLQVGLTQHEVIDCLLIYISFCCDFGDTKGCFLTASLSFSFKFNILSPLSTYVFTNRVILSTYMFTYFLFIKQKNIGKPIIIIKFAVIANNILSPTLKLSKLKQLS